MDPKPRPNHTQYLATLRAMTPEQRLLKALELNELAREFFRTGLRERFPDRSEAELRNLYLERLAQCHKSDY